MSFVDTLMRLPRRLLPATPPASPAEVRRTMAAKVAIELEPKVAFRLPSVDGAPEKVVYYPDMTRNARVEKDAIVYVDIYRDFGKSRQHMILHGPLRAEFDTARIPLAPLAIDGLRDDEVVANAVAHAKDVLSAMRNPVEVPELQDPDDPAASTDHTQAVPVAVTGAAVVPMDVASSPATAVAPGEHPQLVLEGEFMSAGEMPYKHPVTKKLGKPSFAVILLEGNTQRAYHGSDLARVIREAGVLPGDRVRLVKYPKRKVNLGHRVQEMNVWECTVLNRP